jgi:MFS family permease
MNGLVSSSNRAPWLMLAIVCAGFISLTLNWFDVSAAFPLIGADFHVGLGSLSFLVSVFIVGYGLAHIPGGMLATAIGMKRTLVIGLLIQGAAGVMSGLSYNYTELVWFRVISGIGGSVFIAVGFAAVVVWFHDRQLTLALGISGGAARGHALRGAALRAAVASRDLWFYGIALLGGYGAYFTASQLFTEYAIADRHFDPSMGGLLSALIALAGIPGSVLGGWWADRSRNLRAFVVGALAGAAVLLALIPVVPTGVLWVLGIGIGFLVIFGFAAWSSVPARVALIRHEYVGTATGLMLTLAAVGGFFIPIIFGHLVPHTGYAAGWVFLAIVSFVFALVGLLGRNPGRVTAPAAGAAGAAPPAPPASSTVPTE